jgi:hypothetical protein
MRVKKLNSTIINLLQNNINEYLYKLLAQYFHKFPEIYNYYVIISNEIPIEHCFIIFYFSLKINPIPDEND